MAITGIHTLFYSPEADRLRALLADVFEWDHVDAGDGWLIFGTPPGEMAVHPGEKAGHEITFMCDDLEATVADLSAGGVIFEGDPSDEGWGIVITMVLPGEVKALLYEPRHPTAI